ncbi:hypothetical protein M501DRAFT_221434 [Patellaria atrata CBS 101060]|uniref:Uncharacterized protein n=1 Tax=Patellaria atrata CBS 101060 TaxID=1346257 RepID=A0A9P4S6P7_9PEZI|nr:hypothetical protein M501DRAFT_221434 [Patellaria atrata CBS 101060]
MDLKSIINIDSSTNTGQPQAPPRPSPPVATSPHTHHRPSPGTYASPNIYHHTYDSRPPQPVPPYQHQLSPQNDLRSSVIPPYEAVHLSPQLQKHASLPGNQYPFPQRASPSPIQNQQAHPYQRDAYQSTMAVGGAPRPHSNSFSRPTPSPYPPLTTPSNSLGQVQSHTSPSPSISSAHAITPHSLRESPMSASSLSHQNHFQSMTQHSQPGTPLGPPAHYQRTSTFSTMEPPSPYGQTKSQSGASYGPPAGTPGNNASRIASSPGGYEGHGQANDREAIEREYYRERERTVSVSPKTKVPSRQQSAETRHSSQDIWNQAVTPSQVHQNANGVNFHGYETHSPKMTAGGSSRQSSVEVKSSGHDLWNTQVAQTNNQTMVQQDVNGLQSFR